MLVSMKFSMNIARKEGYGIPALRATNEHNLRACIEAAETKQSPLIIIAHFKGTPDICSFGRICYDLASRSNIPISIVLDHGGTFEECIWAIRAGYTDIMVDRSNLELEKNISEVKELVRIAHAVDVGVEAELGAVGSGIEYDSNKCLTVLDEAIRFVEETNIDTLAVAIGTAHGIYKGEPHLNFDLLKELKEKISIPLVLHGGSGTGDEKLSRACKMGICKVNIANDLYKGAINSLLDNDYKGNGAYAMYSYLAKGWKEVTEHFMDICGSTGKAKNICTNYKVTDSTNIEGHNEAKLK